MLSSWRHTHYSPMDSDQLNRLSVTNGGHTSYGSGKMVTNVDLIAKLYQFHSG